jgi:hypothetical protein
VNQGRLCSLPEHAAWIAACLPACLDSPADSVVLVTNLHRCGLRCLAAGPATTTNPLKQVLDAVGESVECVQYKQVNSTSVQYKQHRCLCAPSGSPSCTLLASDAATAACHSMLPVIQCCYMCMQWVVYTPGGDFPCICDADAYAANIRRACRRCLLLRALLGNSTLTL